jgi:hypothetical protein
VISKGPIGPPYWPYVLKIHDCVEFIELNSTKILVIIGKTAWKYGSKNALTCRGISDLPKFCRMFLCCNFRKSLSLAELPQVSEVLPISQRIGIPWKERDETPYFFGFLFSHIKLEKVRQRFNPFLFISSFSCPRYVQTLFSHNLNLHTEWLNNRAVTLISNTLKYYFGEKYRFLHTYL